MEVMTGYKQTEVGVIPNDWDVRKLLSIVRNHNSGIYKGQGLYGRGQNIVGVSDIYLIDKVDGQFFAAVPLSSHEIAKHTLQCNDLLYGESSLVREGIARTVYVTERGAGTSFAWHTRRYSIYQRILRSHYLYYYLQSSPARSHMIRNSIQTAITGINTVAYFACPIIVPSIAEQEAIANALRDADALIESLEQLIAKKRNIKQGAMQELLTGKKRLPGLSGKWEVKRLGEVAPLQRGFDLPNPLLKPGPYPVVYSNGVLNYHSAFQVKGPGVVTGRSGTIGKVSFVEQNYWPHNTSLWVTTFKGNDPKFVFFLFKRIGLERFATGSGVPTLNRNDVHAFKVSIPPSTDEQTAIATILSDMDAEIAALENKLAKTRSLKQGMMHNLLTGRIRLV